MKINLNANLSSRRILDIIIFPFVSGTFNLSRAMFSVSAHNIVLFEDQRFEKVPVVKEYSLDANSNNLVLKFIPGNGSFAFISALEAFSALKEAIPDECNCRGDGSAASDSSKSSSRIGS